MVSSLFLSSSFFFFFLIFFISLGPGISFLPRRSHTLFLFLSFLFNPFSLSHSCSLDEPRACGGGEGDPPPNIILGFTLSKRPQRLQLSWCSPYSPGGVFGMRRERARSKKTIYSRMGDWRWAGVQVFQSAEIYIYIFLFFWFLACRFLWSWELSPPPSLSPPKIFFTQKVCPAFPLFCAVYCCCCCCWIRMMTGGYGIW